MSIIWRRFFIRFSLRWLISSALLCAAAMALTRPVHWSAGAVGLLLGMTALGNMAPAAFEMRRKA